MSTKQIATKKLNVQSAEDFVQNVRDEGAYYVFAAKHTPYANNSDQIITSPTDSVVAGTYDVYNDMLFGKRVQATDVEVMIPRYNWTNGTEYSMYDDTDATLFQKEFYAAVNVGTQVHVYKCLYNNNTASIVEPTGTDINPFETPEDGYIWKYMYTANDTIMRKFATNEYMPLVANATVTANATPGSIDVIKIEDGGLGYNNYLVGAFDLPSDIRVGGSPYLYALGSSASTVDDFYNGCIIKITSGAAKDEYKIITDYYISGGRRIIVIDDVFDGTILPTDTYEIYPYVYVFDTGGVKQTNCIARAIVSNTSGNSITKIEVLETGSGYRSAQALIIPSSVVPVTSNASLRAIISPPGGHGSNIYNELGANFAGISVKFVENETPFPVVNDYRTVGILKDPFFANVNIKIDINETIGAFAVGERVFQYTPVQLTGTVALDGSNTVVGTNTLFKDNLSVGDRVIITDGNANIFANIANISDNTTITIDATNPSFISSNCVIQLARNVSSYGIMTANSAGEIFVSNVAVAGLTTSIRLVGEESFCTSVVDLGQSDPVTINGRNVDSFNKFTQLSRFVGTLTAGAFVEDELLTQDSAIIYAQPQARFHSLNDAISGPNDEMFVTNIKNIFQTVSSPEGDGVITGQTSEAQFTVTAKYNGDLVPDTGEILYLENLNPITRANNQTETFKLILEF